jgi:hypothetical protein
MVVEYWTTKMAAWVIVTRAPQVELQMGLRRVRKKEKEKERGRVGGAILY